MIDFLQDSIWWFNIILSIAIVYLNRRRPARSTNLWLMIMALFPMIGFIPYLLLGRDRRRRSMFKVKQSMDSDLLEKSIVQWDQQRKTLKSYDKGRFEDYKELIELNLRSGFSTFSTDNYVQVYSDGIQKFNALIKDIEEAKKSIELQYYIIKSDQLGNSVFKALIRAALRGVKVRVIADGVGGRKFSRSSRKQMESVGIEIGIFFPSFLKFINLRLNYRNHRKIVVIDDKISYIGGFNIGDEYIGGKKRFGYWRDSHLRIEGPACADMKLSFLQDWQYITKTGISEDEKIVPVSHPAGNAFCQLVSSGPDTMHPNIKYAMQKMIASANKRIIIQSPYFIPDVSMVDSLLIAMRQGVEVSIMIPDRPDHPVVFPATMSFAGDLIKAGAKVYQYNGGFMHAKVLLIDDYVSMVGSCNMDERSFSLNFEASEIVYSYDISRRLRGDFNMDCKKSTLLTPEKYAKRPWSLKVKEPFCRLFSPIL